MAAAFRAAQGGENSSIHLAKNDIERADNRGYVRQHVAAVQKVHRLQMHEGRSADLAPIRFVSSVRNQIDAKFTLGRLDRGIGFALRNVIALGIKLEVMDERFHRAFHFGALWRYDLM